jgi:hypothetical protein
MARRDGFDQNGMMKLLDALCAFAVTNAFLLTGLCADPAGGRQRQIAAQAKGPIMAEVLAASQPGDWRSLDPENTLYMDLPGGRVVIELAPAFAPQHVANVKALAREKYYDGLAVVRVQDNYVVQWADPDARKARTRAQDPARTAEPAPGVRASARSQTALHAPARRRCVCGRSRVLRRLPRGARPAQRQNVAGASLWHGRSRARQRAG